MLRLLKWAYSLGVKQERNRIKQLIYEFSDESNRMHEELMLLERRPTKSRIQKMDERKAAQQILNGLIEPKFIGERSYGPAPIDGES